MFRFVAAIAAASALLIAAPAANAASLFAAPNGDDQGATNTCTDSSTPCSLSFAVETKAQAGDDVSLAPGTYTLSDELTIPNTVPAVTVHGSPGARPTIEAAVNSLGATGVRNNGVLRDVNIVETVQTPQVLKLEESTDLAERVFVHATGAQSRACELAGTIRDSVCWASGASGIGARLGIGPGFSASATLRNVTAVSSGTGASWGIEATSSGNGMATINATNTIADGSAADVETSISTGSASVVLDHSNYDTVNTSFGGTITPPGMNNNQQTPPEFVDAAAGDFHQKASSAGTLDLGTSAGVDPAERDLDAQNRSIGAAVDIGADELAHTTQTQLLCSPSSVVVGAYPSTCEAFVTDLFASPSLPTGAVRFISDGPGVFSDGGSCSPVSVLMSVNQSSCKVTYTPTAVGTGTHHITASYGSDVTHDPSQGATDLSVSAASGTGTPSNPSSPGTSTGTPVPTGSATPAAPRKKCKKKKKRAAAAKKCRKKKK